MDDEIFGRRVCEGSIVEILPAYDMETGRRTRFDEIAGCEGRVLSDLRDGYLLVAVAEHEHHITRGRLKWIAGPSN